MSESKAQWFARALVLLGLALVSVGAYFVYPPLVLIVPGVFLMVFGIGHLLRDNEAAPR